MELFQMFLSGSVCVLVAVLVFLLIKLTAMSGMFGNTVRFLLGNNYDYDQAVDIEVSSLLDKIDSGKVSASLTSDYTISAGDKKLWVGNFPYAYAHIRGKDARVSLKTFKRVRKLHLELVSKS